MVQPDSRLRFSGVPPAVLRHVQVKQGRGDGWKLEETTSTFRSARREARTTAEKTSEKASFDMFEIIIPGWRAKRLQTTAAAAAVIRAAE